MLAPSTHSLTPSHSNPVRILILILFHPVPAREPGAQASEASVARIRIQAAVLQAQPGEPLSSVFSHCKC